MDKKLCANDKCLEKTCDEWVAKGLSCDYLKQKHKCSCKMCQCTDPKPIKSCVIITGVFNGPQGGPNGVELHAICDVKDLSTYGLGTANNGGGTDGQEFQFSKMEVKEGTFFYVTQDKFKFKNFFAFDAEFQMP